VSCGDNFAFSCEINSTDGVCFTNFASQQFYPVNFTSSYAKLTCLGNGTIHILFFSTPEQHAIFSPTTGIELKALNPGHTTGSINPNFHYTSIVDGGLVFQAYYAQNGTYWIIWTDFNEYRFLLDSPQNANFYTYVKPSFEIKALYNKSN